MTDLSIAKTVQSGLRSLTVQQDALVKSLSAGTLPTTPPVTPPVTNPPDTPPVVIPPPTGTPTGAPTGLSDPRFNACKAHAPFLQDGGTISDFIIDDPSGQPSIGYSKIIAKRGIIRSREGIRIAGPGSVYEDMLIIIKATGDDHGDGVQFYGPGPTGDATFRRIRIEMQAGSENCGFFCADRANADVVIEDMDIIGGANCPNGGIWLPNRSADKACNSLSYKNLRVDFCNRGVMGVDYDGGGAKPIIKLWENVQTLQNGVWVQVPRPY